MIRLASRHRFLGPALGVALVVAACGGDADDAGDSTTTLPTATTADVTAPPTSAADASATSAPPETEPAGETFVVITEFGDFEVPADPARIVVTDPIIALPTALDLGAPVIATTFPEEGSPNDLLTPGEVEALTSVGTFGLPTNLELIAAAEPDLILASPDSAEEFELIAEIAPSVPTVVSGQWRDDARVVGEALGATGQLEALIAAYDERAAALAERLDEELGDETVVVVRVRPEVVRVHTNHHFAGNVLTDVGLAIPEQWVRADQGDSLANARNRVIDISPELLGDLDADHIILLVEGRPTDTPEEEQAAFDAIASSPLWTSLPAVQNDNVHVADRYWLAGSVRAAEAALTDLEAWLLAP
ncbi:MAG: ABC transporter substrate-binding protein [Actinomycetota bacterium]